MTPPTCQWRNILGELCGRPAAVRLYQTPEQQTLGYAMDGWYCDGCATMTENYYLRNGGVSYEPVVGCERWERKACQGLTGVTTPGTLGVTTPKAGSGT